MKKYFLYWALAFYGFLTVAQPQSILHKNVYFEQLAVDLGLSQRSINCMLQDHKGYLWIGTWSGLIKYDGYSTTVFRADNFDPDQLKSNKIIRIYESRDSTLWVATRSGGLFRKSKTSDKFDQYTNEPGCENCLSSRHVWDIVEDAHGGLWIGTENGLNYMDPQGKIYSYFYDPADPASLSFNFITRLMIDSHGKLWVATEYGINLMINDDPANAHFERILYKEDKINDELHNYVYDLRCIDNAQGSTVYWVTKKGMKKYNGRQIVNYELHNRPSSFNIFRCMDLVSVTDPFLLLGSDMGLSVFDIKKNEFVRFFGDFDKEVNLSQNTVTALLIDRSGVLWAGTKRGLNKYDSYDNNIGLYMTRTFDPTNGIITALAQDAAGHVWLSTLGGGLFELNLRSGVVENAAHYKLIDHDDVDFTDYIQKFIIDSNGRFWIGTAGAGLYVFDSKNIDHAKNCITRYQHYDRATPVQLSDDYVMSLCESASGGVWVGTWSKGLNLVTDDGEVIAIEDDRLSAAPLVSIYEDDGGVLWIGTRGAGLMKLQVRNRKIISLQTYQFDKENARLSNDFVNAIYKDTQGRLWVGTEEGLSMYDEKADSFQLIQNEQDKSLRDVVGILQDPSGLLWLAGNEGITSVNPDQTPSMYVNHFDTKDRIQGGFFYNEVTLKTDDGYLIFGGARGFNVINPLSIYQNPDKPLIVIKEIRVLDQVLVPGKEIDGRVIIDIPIDEVSELKLNPSENTIAFEFAALHYANPAKNRYSYKLVGFDDTWQYTTANRRFAKYTNLNPGTYEFKIRASNDDGYWTEESRTVKFVIPPPWWRTAWALVAYFALGLLFLWLFRRMILARSAYEHDIRFERMERENTEKLNKSRLQFFTNISHEFRTPLTLILGLLEELIQSGDGGVKVQKQLKMIDQNAGRLQRLINQLLDFRKVEAGSLKLRVAEGNFYKFAKELKLSFDSLAIKKQIEYRLVSSSNVIQLFFDRDQFEKILSNLLSNAFKHTSEGGKVTIELLELEDRLQIAVVDTGDGIAEHNLSRIFDRFYTGEQDAGTGIGLALCKSLVELHHGTICVESEPGRGSRFTVSIPKGFSHFDPSELIEGFMDSEQIQQYYRSEEVEPVTDENVSPVSDISQLKKLLIVEDNADVRSFLKSVFQYEYAVFEAENGQIGLSLAEEIDPDLVLSDVMMPVMDGITLCQKIKENISTSHIPVILLTARTSFVYTVEGLEKGADDYVTKPFQVRVLKLKVRNLIKTHDQMRKLAQDSEYLDLEPRSITVTSTDEIFLNRCLDLMEEHMDDSEYTVVEFGKDIGLSRMQLYRKLKALTGKSPNEFIRMIRVKRAAQLLEKGDFNVAEVTYKVGFSDPAYFRKCFKGQFGITPSDYARNRQK